MIELETGQPPLTQQQQQLYMRIFDALSFICKPMILPDIVVTEAALKAFGIILKFKQEQSHDDQSR